MIVSWFSAGVSSAVATKIANSDRIIYIHIDDQHPDTLRFIKDCEAWFGKPVEILQSPYKCVKNAVFAGGGSGYINGPHGAACTLWLKKRVRKEWELDNPGRHTYVWGFDSNERDRADRITQTMPDFDHLFPILDRTKAEVHGMLEAAGIRRPVMYDLGYHNNNCVGCVKGGMGYWNKIRVDFPDVFAGRAKLERVIGASCIKGVYLDELDPQRGRHEGPIVPDCGIFCEIQESPILGKRSPAQGVKEICHTASNRRSSMLKIFFTLHNRRSSMLNIFFTF